jgi:hypothetical protein
MNLANGNFDELKLIILLICGGVIIFAVTMLLLMATIRKEIEMAKDEILDELKKKNKE